MVSATSRLLYPPGKTRYSLYRRLGRPQVRYGRVRKISPPTGIRSPTVQPVASRYTDCAIPAPLMCKYRPTFMEKILLPFSGYKNMTVGNVGKGFFNWLTDVFGTSNPFCPLDTIFPACLTSTLTKETANYSESLVTICLSLPGVTSEKTVILFFYVP